MDSIANHYSVRRAATATSQASGSTTRSNTSTIVTPGTKNRRPRPSSSLASARRVVLKQPTRTPAIEANSLAEPANERMTKRPRVSHAAIVPAPADGQKSSKSPLFPSEPIDGSVDAPKTSQEENALKLKEEGERLQRKDAARRKLAIAKARRSSVANQGRQPGSTVSIKPLPRKSTSDLLLLDLGPDSRLILWTI